MKKLLFLLLSLVFFIMTGRAQTTKPAPVTNLNSQVNQQVDPSKAKGFYFVRTEYANGIRTTQKIVLQ